jgi:hypothetical protein
MNFGNKKATNILLPKVIDSSDKKLTLLAKDSRLTYLGPHTRAPSIANRVKLYSHVSQSKKLSCSQMTLSIYSNLSVAEPKDSTVLTRKPTTRQNTELAAPKDAS